MDALIVQVQFVIDAVYAMAYALHTKWMSACKVLEEPWDLGRSVPVCDAIKRVDGKDLYDNYLLNVSFEGFIGKHIYRLLLFHRSNGQNIQIRPAGRWTSVLSNIKLL
jgi:hypothetical protein